MVYLLCVRLSCLALGHPAPPEVHAELEKRSSLKTLGRTVKETLVAKQYLPLLGEGRKGSWAGSGSVSSWDEPLGFLERKREVLLDKRSYSDSDLSKIAVQEVQFHIYLPEFLSVNYTVTDYLGSSDFVAFCLLGPRVESILHPSTWK